MTNPYYQDDFATIYHGDCREVLPGLGPIDLIITDPPYPNNAGHFTEDIAAAEWIAGTVTANAWFWFWHPLRQSPILAPLVARHVWHRTNSNRPANSETIYEHAVDGIERPSRVFAYPVVFPGLTGCTEATGHPTQKPERLMRRLLALRPALSVVDPFMGSGTTVAAAKSLNRKAIGIEQSERYCEIAAKRLGQEVLDFGATA